MLQCIASRVRISGQAPHSSEIPIRVPAVVVISHIISLYEGVYETMRFRCCPSLTGLSAFCDIHLSGVAGTRRVAFLTIFILSADRSLLATLKHLFNSEEIAGDKDDWEEEEAHSWRRNHTRLGKKPLNGPWEKVVITRQLKMEVSLKIFGLSKHILSIGILFGTSKTWGSSNSFGSSKTL